MAFSYLKINKYSPTPLYFQIYNQMRLAIETNKLKPGDKIPTEEEICDAYNVSRPVVRQAYQKLINLNMIERHKGRGTFVKQNFMTNNLSSDFANFEKDMQRINRVPSTKTIKKELVTVSENQKSTRLGLDIGDEVLYLQQIKYADSEPKVLVESYISIKYLFDEEEFNLETSTEYVFNLIDKEAAKTTSVLQAKTLTAVESKLLDVEKNEACICITNIKYDVSGYKLVYSASKFPASKNKFYIK